MIRITIPGEIKPIFRNSMKPGGMAQYRQAKKWKRDAGLIINAQLNHNYPRRDLKAPVCVHVEYRFKLRRTRDEDGIMGGSHKWLIDLLKDNAWIGDDDHKSCRQTIEIFDGCAENEMVITIRKWEKE